MNKQSSPYIPKPRLVAGYSRVNRWYCSSQEYCTWDGLLGFSASGHGDTIQEAYEDWLDVYINDRYIKKSANFLPRQRVENTYSILKPLIVREDPRWADRRVGKGIKERYDLYLHGRDVDGE